MKHKAFTRAEKRRYAKQQVLLDDREGIVYILRFKSPLGDPEKAKGQARFYIGWTERTIEERLQEHEQGRGARITAAARARGIEWELVYSAKGKRIDEFWIKEVHAQRFLDRQMRSS